MAAERGFAAAPGPVPGPGPGLGPTGSVLMVVGSLPDLRALEPLLGRVEEGVRSWSVDLLVSSLDEQLKLFVSRHSAFLSEDVPGQRTLQHCGDVLHTQVLLNPTHELVCTEVQRLVCSSVVYQLLLFVGVCEEETGDVILQKGRFTSSDLLMLLNTQVSVLRDLPIKPSLTLCVPSFGCWTGPWLQDLAALQSVLDLKVNPAPVLPPMEGLQEFTEYLSESLTPDSPLDLLEPPDAPGFLRLCQPCCYVFPGGRGDSAFFSVCGFNVLVNGGSDPRSCFWKLIRHLDRVDSVLLTHCGSDNLPGVISLLQRKLSEQHLEPDVDQTKNLISPEIGVVFFNAPEPLKCDQEDPSKMRSCDLAAVTLQLLNRLSITPRPLSRVSGSTQPLVLFQKLGVGCLELYTLNPLSGLAHAPNVSVCVLLVWHPANPQEKIVRVLFPGQTPQNKLLEGLETLKHLQFLQHPSPCPKDLQTSKTKKEPSPERSESRVSSSSQRDKRTEPKKAKPVPPDDKTKVLEVDVRSRTSKPAEKLPTRKDTKEEKVSTLGKKEEKKKEPIKKDPTSTKPKIETEPKKKLKPEPKKDPKPVLKKEPEPKRDPKTVLKKEPEPKKETKPALKKEPEPKRETKPVLKKEPEPKRDSKRELKPEEKKSLKTSQKEVRRGPGGASAVGPDTLKNNRTLEREEMSLKKGPPGNDPNSSHFNGLNGGPEKPVTDSINVPQSSENRRLDTLDLDEDKSPSEPQIEEEHPSLSGPEGIPQHVDVCLVSPCEFQHLHVPQSQDEGLDGTSPSEDLDLDCPTVSEEESGCVSGLSDPSPIPVVDQPPLPAQPGSCTVDSEENQKTSSVGIKKPPQQRNGRTSSSTGSQRTFPGSETKLTGRHSVGGGRTKVPAAAGSVGSAGHVVYVDLAYLPSGQSSIDADLFRCLRSSHYVLSGDDPRRDTRKVLDALLEGKSCWAQMKVTLIPTFDSSVMREWYQQTLQQQGALSLTVLGSSSTVAMQDHSFPACKVELH